MYVKPLAEGDHKRWLGASAISNCTALTDSELDQILVKELHSELRVVARRSAV
jgi:hypothetical protein